uniref:Uncharacterized protein n=1 Tax=Poecilia formosa TaxID=48698 RepID=A0A096M348_POEFO
MESAVDVPSGEDEAPEKDDVNAKESTEVPRRRKGEKESSSESGAESDVEPGQKKSLKKQQTNPMVPNMANVWHQCVDTDGGSKSSRSPSDSSSASGSDSEGEEPTSRPEPKDSQGEEQVAPILIQKPELPEVKKEEITDMEVPSTDENHSCANEIEKDKISPSTGQDEITQTDTVEVKIESSYGEAKFMHVQELPDIIPKQEGTTPKDDLILKDQTSLVPELQKRSGRRSRSTSLSVTPMKKASK